MSFRLRLLLALGLVAVIPALLLTWRARPRLDEARARYVREAAERSELLIAERLDRWAVELASEVSAWRNQAADEFQKLDDWIEHERGLARRRLRDAIEAIETAAVDRGLNAGLVIDGTGRVRAAWPESDPPRRPASSEALAEGLARWSWEEPSSPLQLRTVALCPPSAPRESALLLLAERRLSAQQLTGEMERLLGYPVRVDPRPAGQPLEASGERLVRVPIPRSGPPPVAVVELDLEDAGQLLFEPLRFELGIAVALGLAAAVLLALLLSDSLARPVRRLTASVTRFAEGDLAPSPMPQGPGELGTLASAVDRMLARIDREQHRRARAERLAAWQQVARRVAHEVRNPLTPIRLAVDNLRRAARRDPQSLTEHLDDESAAILQEVDRLERLVREFSEFARLPEPEPRPVELPELVERAVRGQIPADGSVRVAFDIDEAFPCSLAVDPDLLSLALANLARNAAQAMEAAGGQLRVRMQRRHEAGPPAGDGAAIVFDDTGPGISDEIIGHVFEPYVSGRGETGTGLGLAIVRRIVRDHGGLVTASNRVEGGARFEIILPLGGRSFDEPRAG
ncbi:MAG: HAMP domain-containing protein [Acidobacteriota bacterium]|nr:MAG: HAMP domain-containing protein [Acidobacteriota bacterium]